MAPNRKSTTAACVGIFCLLGVDSYGQQRIDAKSFFGGLNPPPVIDIGVYAPDVLVFRESDRDSYCLNGASLIMDVDTIEVLGTVVVKSFCKDQGRGENNDTPGDAGASRGEAGNDCGPYRVDGCPGATGGIGGEGGKGKAGVTGKSASWIRLSISSLKGEGTLTVDSTGGEGGKGAPGGVGGNGGEGGTGQDRTCKTVCGVAGIGGDCGKGGPGGKGGTGGDAGQIEYVRSMSPMVNAKLLLRSEGGLGGWGGGGGDPGKPGNHGGGGSGNSCGGGCSGNVATEKPGRCGDVPERGKGESQEKIRGLPGASKSPKVIDP